MRTKKAIINTISSLLYQLVAIVCGLILPKMILTYFGSSYNGITSSIAQFLSCASLLVAGVGGVTRASLFKPLAENNTYKVSAIINATEHFMRRIALILLLGIFAMACLYPFLVSYEFDWLFSFSLVLILGISTFLQYYFGVTYQILLQADQRQYVISTVQLITTVLNTLFAVVLLKCGFGIHIVKLASAVAFSFNPLIINIYVRRHFAIDKKVEPDNSALKQRWDAFWQAIAYFVHNNTDVIVLTVFADIKEVSVYTVYNYVISNIRNIIVNCIMGFGAAFGNMLAKKEYELAHKNLRIYELIIFNLSAIIYTTTGLLIVPFALIYTRGITDISYSRPLFALIATMAGAINCFRMPYQTIVEAAGHFKQTRNGALFEATMNITLSLILVAKYGIIGVAIGTLAATIFRSFQYAIYLSKNVLKRSLWIFIGHIVTNVFITVIAYYISTYIMPLEMTNFINWALNGVIVVVCVTFVTLTFDMLFYKEDLNNLLSKVIKR